MASKAKELVEKAASFKDIAIKVYGEDPVNIGMYKLKRVTDFKYQSDDSGLLDEPALSWEPPDEKGGAKAFFLSLTVKTAKAKKVGAMVQTDPMVFKSTREMYDLGNFKTEEQKKSMKMSPEFMALLPETEQKASFSMTPSLHAPFKCCEIQDGPYKGCNKYAIEFYEGVIKVCVDGIKRCLMSKLYGERFPWRTDFLTELRDVYYKDVKNYEWKSALKAMPWKQFFFAIAKYCSLGIEKQKTEGDAKEGKGRQQAAAEEEDDDPTKKAKPKYVLQDGIDSFEELVKRMNFYMRNSCFRELKTDEERSKYTPYPISKYSKLEGYNGPASLEGNRAGIKYKYNPFPVFVVSMIGETFYSEALPAKQRCNPAFFEDDMVCRMAIRIRITPDNNKGFTKLTVTADNVTAITMAEIPQPRGKLEMDLNNEATDSFAKRIAARAAEEKKRQMEEEARERAVKALEEEEARNRAAEVEASSREAVKRKAIEDAQNVSEAFHEEDEVPVKKANTAAAAASATAADVHFVIPSATEEYDDAGDD